MYVPVYHVVKTFGMGLGEICQFNLQHTCTCTCTYLCTYVQNTCTCVHLHVNKNFTNSTLLYYVHIHMYKTIYFPPEKRTLL